MTDIAAGFNTRAAIQNEYTDSAKKQTCLRTAGRSQLKPVGAGFAGNATTCTGVSWQNGLSVSQQRLLCASQTAVVFGRRACRGEIA